VIGSSDRGGHRTSPQHLALRQAAGVGVSMGGKGRALGNAFTERRRRAVKYEGVYPHSYGSPRAARTGLTRYLAFYKRGRLHHALAYRTPAEVYFGTPAPQPPGA
jgi:putative transposase